MLKSTPKIATAMILCATACGGGNDANPQSKPPANGSGGAPQMQGASSGTGGGSVVGSGGTSAGPTAGTGSSTMTSGGNASMNMGGLPGNPMGGSGAPGGTAMGGRPGPGMGGAMNVGGMNTAGAMNVGGMNGTAGGATMGGAGGMSSGGAGNPPTMNGMFTVSSMLASQMDPKAPTTVGIVTWSVASITVASAYIEFGLDTSYGMKAPVELTAMDHRTLLLGMKPNKTYHFRVVASDGSANYASEDYTIQTGAATTAVKIGSFDVKQEMGRERGFIVLSYWQGTGSSVAFIVDADGDIVWAYDFGMSGGIARARMSYNGHDMWAVTADNMGQPIRRVGMDGLNAQTYSSTKASHDITAVSGDTMAYLDYSVSCNDINEIDPSGTTKKIFTASAVFGSQCHGNAVRYSEAEDQYTYSVVDKDIIRVDRKGQKLWSLAETVMGGNKTWGAVQHGNHLLANSILIFANRGGSTGTISAMIEYDFTGKELSSYEANANSPNLGDVQRLPGGNTLVDFSNVDLVHQIDSKGTLLVEIKGPGGQNKFGYATWRPTLYGPSPDITD